VGGLGDTERAGLAELSTIKGDDFHVALFSSAGHYHPFPQKIFPEVLVRGGLWMGCGGWGERLLGTDELPGGIGEKGGKGHAFSLGSVYQGVFIVTSHLDGDDMLCLGVSCPSRFPSHRAPPVLSGTP